MIFIVAYTLFETPSNYMLKKFRPSRWYATIYFKGLYLFRQLSNRIAALMFGWGATTMVLGAVHNFASLVAIRFLLGALEAGLFPGMIYCLTFWYKQDERALRAALIIACATLGISFR